MAEKIKAIIKRPYEPVGRIREIDNTLEALQAAVDGYIETVTIAEDTVVICNEEGQLRNMPYNCEICGINFVGTILLVGSDGEDFTDVPVTLEEFEQFILSE